MSFTEAIKSVFNPYIHFDGRARRSEYWYFALFNIIVSVVLSALITATGIKQLSILSTLYSLAVLLPSLGVEIRRLHDIGKSGWYILFAFIPCVGAILLLIWLTKDSDPGDNQYGPNPKEPSAAYTEF